MKKIAFFALCFLSSLFFQNISAMEEDRAKIVWQKLEAAEEEGADLHSILQHEDPNLVFNSRGRSLLQEAVTDNRVVLVTALLNAKADPNYICEKDHATALSLNSTRFCKDSDCIPLLLEAKADVNLHVRFPQAKSALDQAIISRNFTAIIMLTNAGIDESTALKFARECYKKATGSRAKNSADAIVKFFEGRAAMRRATYGPPAHEEEKEDAPPKYAYRAEQHGNNGLAVPQDGGADGD